MTVKEVSDRLRLSQAKVYALTQSGDLECYRFGRSIRVDARQLASYLGRASEPPRQTFSHLKLGPGRAKR